MQIGEDLERDMNRTRKLIFNLAKSYKRENSTPNHTIKNEVNNLLIEPHDID